MNNKIIGLMPISFKRRKTRHPVQQRIVPTRGLKGWLKPGISFIRLTLWNKSFKLIIQHVS